jgi:hypothetical protein
MASSFFFTEATKLSGLTHRQKVQNFGEFVCNYPEFLDLFDFCGPFFDLLLLIQPTVGPIVGGLRANMFVWPLLSRSYGLHSDQQTLGSSSSRVSHLNPRCYHFVESHLDTQLLQFFLSRSKVFVSFILRVHF